MIVSFHMREESVFEHSTMRRGAWLECYECKGSSASFVLFFRNLYDIEKVLCAVQHLKAQQILRLACPDIAEVTV